MIRECQRLRAGLGLDPGHSPGPGFMLGLGLIFSIMASPVCAQSLTLLEGLEVVTSQGYDVRIAEAHRESAALAVNLTESRMRPQANAYADHTWLKNRPEAIFGAGTSPLSEDHFLRYGVTVSQTITDFGRTAAGVDSARAGALAQAVHVDQARNGTALAFVHAYLSLLKAEKTLIVTEQEVKRFEAHAANARHLYDAGEVTRSDVLIAEVALADALQRKISARDGRELAASRINYLILQPLDQSIQVVDFPSLKAGFPVMDDSTVAAETARPELRILDQKITALESDLRMRRSDDYPVVFVSGGYSFEENPYRVYEDNWSVVLGITWDLYTGGARSAGEAQIVQELAAAVAERERMKETIFLEVREALLNFNGAAERISVAEKTLKQAEENLRLQKARYQEGEVSATDVTDAVTTLTKAQNSHWDAIYDRQLAEAQILYATGSDLKIFYETASLTGKEMDPKAKEPGE